MFKVMYRYLKRYKINLLLFSVFLVLATMSSFFVPKILGDYIDSLAKYKDIWMNIFYSFIVISIVETISSYLSRYLRNKIANRITLDMIKDLTAHIIKLPTSFFKEQEVMYLSNRVNSDSFNLGDFTLKIISDAFINVICLVVSFIYILYVDLGIGIKLLFLIPLYLAIYKILEKTMFTRALECKEETNKAMGVMNNQYLNIKVTKINNWYKAYGEKLTTYTDRAQNFFEKYCRVLFLFDGIDIMIKRIAMLILIAYSGALVLSGKLTPGQFTIIIAYFNIAFTALTGFIEFAKGYQDAKASYTRVDEIMSIPCEQNGMDKLQEIDEITFKDLTFCYDDDRVLFKNFNYTFKKGKIYCIKGKNGIGKSTLTELMVGINENYTGKILYNNKNIKNLDLYNLRTNSIGYVEQVPNLIDGTLLENLTMGLENYDVNCIKNYCKSFFADEILPKGYEDVINSNNTNLSGGERQKIVISRALGKEAQVLIMDEPTSALDIKSKEKLKEILLKIKENKIIILITHDEEFEKISDNIVSIG